MLFGASLIWRPGYRLLLPPFNTLLFNIWNIHSRFWVTKLWFWWPNISFNILLNNKTNIWNCFFNCIRSRFNFEKDRDLTTIIKKIFAYFFRRRRLIIRVKDGYKVKADNCFAVFCNLKILCHKILSKQIKRFQLM